MILSLQPIVKRESRVDTHKYSLVNKDYIFYCTFNVLHLKIIMTVHRDVFGTRNFYSEIEPENSVNILES